MNRGLVESQARAQALLIAGRVYSGEQRIDKPGTLIRTDIPLQVRGIENPYVSRGGLKLAGALDEFLKINLDPSNKITVDVGASTGGFTDCLLQRGALRVYAVDVGWGQLHPKLRTDPRVVVRERTNAKGLSAADFPEPIDLIVVDASFIGLGSLAPALAAILRPEGDLCAMVKPQFEATREEVHQTHGVIRDELIRQRAIGRARTALEQQGFSLLGACDAPLAGPRGNLEHFLYAKSSSRIR